MLHQTEYCKSNTRDFPHRILQKIANVAARFEKSDIIRLICLCVGGVLIETESELMLVVYLDFGIRQGAF